MPEAWPPPRCPGGARICLRLPSSRPATIVVAHVPLPTPLALALPLALLPLAPEPPPVLLPLALRSERTDAADSRRMSVASSAVGMGAPRPSEGGRLAST